LQGPRKTLHVVSIKVEANYDPALTSVHCADRFALC
jgi:hypothetical protein